MKTFKRSSREEKLCQKKISSKISRGKIFIFDPLGYLWELFINIYLRLWKHVFRTFVHPAFHKNLLIKLMSTLDTLGKCDWL